jgi:hypothetical protein
VKRFNFRKFIKRNDFTSVFGNIGARRTITRKKPINLGLRFMMQQIRRAHQGWRNKVFGMKTALRIRKKYGRRKPIGSFRR